MTSVKQQPSDSYSGRNTFLDYGVVVLIYGAGIFFLLLMQRQRARVDELWKEYDTHVKYCGCMTREYDIDRDGGGK